MIDTSAFKTAIIDLAVTGQLSAQFHAEDSVEEITAALPPLSNKRKKLLGQSFEYGNQAPLPDHWRWICLGEISSYGDTPQKAFFDDVNGDTWILDLEDIKSGGQIIKKARVHGKKFIGDKTVFSEGQVLYSKLRPYLKKVLVADEDGISTPELISFDTFGGVIPQYIVYCLLSSFTDRAIEKRSYGIKMPRIDAAFMVNLPIPVPPVSEQQFIVDRVQEDFSQIDTIDSMQAHYADNLSVLKGKLIDAAIRGMLTERLPQDGNSHELLMHIQEEKEALIKTAKIKKGKVLPEITEEETPFTIPANWKWVRLSNLMIVMSTGPFGSMLHKSDYVENGIPVINPANIENGSIFPSSKMQVSLETKARLAAYELHKGMIIMGRRGEMGRCAVVGSQEDGWLCGTGSFFMQPSERISSEFVSLLISSPYAKGYLSGQSIGMTMDNLNQNILNNLPFPLPPLAEQTRIVQKVKELMPILEQ